MIRVAILGATGYTALELMKLLLRHPEVEITTLTSRQTDRPHVGTVHPQLVGRLDVHLENLAPEELVSRADCVFSCLPHAASATVVHRLLDAGLSVVDFSADYRINDLDVYNNGGQCRYDFFFILNLFLFVILFLVVCRFRVLFFFRF